jgi:rhamnosyltransferase
MNGYFPSPERVCAVMVTHRIGAAVRTALVPLLPQVGHLIVVDNASDDDTRRAVEACAAEHPGIVELLTRGENNLAAAQNDGIRSALELGYAWVLLMDHDSVAEPGMVATLLAAGSAQPEPEQIGIVAPCLVDSHSRRPARYPQAAGRVLFRRRGFTDDTPVLDHLLGVVASGSLIAAPLLRRIGLMDESFGIDYVDKEFCLRAVRAGYRVIAVRDAVLVHSLGQCRDHTPLPGVSITTTNHSAGRRHSIYRNRIRCWRRHGAAIPAFVLYDLLSVGYDLLRVLFFERNARAKLRAMMRGIYDGVRTPATPGNTPPPSTGQ